MQTRIVITPLHRFLHLLLICVLVSACGGSSLTPLSENDLTEPASPTDRALPATMGIVLDPLGNPISFALVGGTEFTTSEGVFPAHCITTLAVGCLLKNLATSPVMLELAAH